MMIISGLLFRSLKKVGLYYTRNRLQIQKKNSAVNTSLQSLGSIDVLCQHAGEIDFSEKKCIVPIHINFRHTEIGAILTSLREKKIKVRIVPRLYAESAAILRNGGPMNHKGRITCLKSGNKRSDPRP